MANDVRTIMDTGVIVSGLLLPNSVPRLAFDRALALGRLLVSEHTITELDDVLRRSKFDRYLSEAKRLEFLAGMVHEAELIVVTDNVTACRDPADNKFLELAMSGGASHIVTGDSDLLALHPYRGVAIVSPQVFLQELSH